MYKIIGVDQKEYGPITEHQLRQWITEGRVNAQTQVMPEGATEWQPLSTIPAFATSFPAAPVFTLDAVDTSSALQQVQGPAIALLVVAIICFIAAISGLLMNILGTSLNTFGGPSGDQFQKYIEMTSGAVGIVMNLLGLGVSGLILVGALKMKKLQSYTLVMIANICSMLPCISPCCCVGLPIGIWVLIVLCKPEVKAAFQ